MPTYHVKWRVIETINGPGKHDDGVRDGERRVAAEGETDKEAESAAAIRADLTAVLRRGFPEHGLGPTYDIDRHYEIEITPDDESNTVTTVLLSGQYAALPIGRTTVKSGDGTCANRARRRWRRKSPEHLWTWRPIGVTDVDEAEQAKPGIAFPMATFTDELTCNRCGEVVVQKVRGRL